MALGTIKNLGLTLTLRVLGGLGIGSKHRVILSHTHAMTFVLIAKTAKTKVESETF